MKKQTKIIIGIVAIVAVIVGTLSFKHFREGSAGADGAIHLGIILPETGNFSQLGIPKRQAFTLANDTLNNSGGIDGKPVELVFGDSQGNPQMGVSTLQQMNSIHNVDIFFVDLTPVAAAAAPVADRLGVVMFVGTTHPTLPDQSPWVFRVFASARQEMSMMAGHLKKENVETAFVLHTADTMGQEGLKTFTATFSEHGGRVVGSDSFRPGEQDTRNILLRARDSGAQKIFIMDYGITLTSLLTQANQLNIPSSRFVGNMGFVSPQAAKLDPKLTAGIVFTGPAFALASQQPEDSPATQFNNAFFSRFHSAPDYTAAYAYDTYRILTEALRNTNNSRGKPLIDAILKTQNYAGASGVISMLPNGDSTTSMALMSYVDSKIAPYDHDANR